MTRIEQEFIAVIAPDQPRELKLQSIEGMLQSPVKTIFNDEDYSPRPMLTPLMLNVAIAQKEQKDFTKK